MGNDNVSASQNELFGVLLFATICTFIMGFLTVSIGVAQYKPKEAVESLIQRADTAMYLLKGRGKTG